MSPVAVHPRPGSGLGFLNPLVSHSGFLEGESSAFPLPTVAQLPASPSRTLSSDQEGHPPRNPGAWLSPTLKLAPTQPSLFSRFVRETVPAQASTGFLAQAPRLFSQFPSGLSCLSSAKKMGGTKHSGRTKTPRRLSSFVF